METRLRKSCPNCGATLREQLGKGCPDCKVQIGTTFGFGYQIPFAVAFVLWGVIALAAAYVIGSVVAPELFP